MKAGAIVLAAGESTRLGEPKQLVALQGERLLERAARVATEAGLDPVVVVLGCRAEEIQQVCRLGPVQGVVNAEWREGMASSVRAGVAMLEKLDTGVGGAVVMTCDQPAVTSEHLRRLVREGSDEVTVSSKYAGKRGVPVYFPLSRFEELKRLRGEEGARALLGGSREVELTGGELDIDTKESLEEARELIR